MYAANSQNCHNGQVDFQEIEVGSGGIVHPSMEYFDKMNEIKQNGNGAFNFTTVKDKTRDKETIVNGGTIQNGITYNGKYGLQSLLVNGELLKNEPIVNNSSQSGPTVKEDPTAKKSIMNVEHAQNRSVVENKHAQNGINGMYMYMATSEVLTSSYSNNNVILNIDRGGSDQELKNNEYSHAYESARFENPLISSGSLTNINNLQTLKRPRSPVVITDKLTAADLRDLFEDQICVLHIPNYVPHVVCNKLDGFLRDRGSDQYTHEIRKDGRADLLYFGVNRYGFPLNSTYNDSTGKSMDRYFSEALPTMQSIRRAAAPYLSPIDKLRVELDETWHRKVNVATLNGQKTFCGIGRVMPASLSELSADQPHFDAVPTTYFPDIHKQFAANIYLNVPEEGGELEIWNVPPVDVENVENFVIPDDWRSQLPVSIKVKPGAGDLLLLNTRRPHAVTKFAGDRPRTSLQSFIGLTKESDVFLWV